MKLIAVLLTTLAIGSAACLTSPLLDHANAGSHLKEAQPVKASNALQFEKQGLEASMTWVKEPSDEEKGELTVRFWKKGEGSEFGPYVDPGYKVVVKLWMPDMGHGSSPVKVESAVDTAGAPVTGVYDATDVYFVMGGKWEIWLLLKNGNEIVGRAKLDYEIEE